MSDDLRECPVCGRNDLRGAQGISQHLIRAHPDYDRGEAEALRRAEEQTDEITLEFSVAFTPEEVVLLQALTFLGGDDLNDLAAQAFNDLLTWARDHDNVQTLIELRDAWRGDLVEGGDTNGGHLAAVPEPPDAAVT